MAPPTYAELPATLDRLDGENGMIEEHAGMEVPADLAVAPLRKSVPAPARAGRPRTGKRSNPAFEQVSVYIRKDTHREAKIALLREARGRQFSELVEDLLSEWLEQHS